MRREGGRGGRRREEERRRKEEEGGEEGGGEGKGGEEAGGGEEEGGGGGTFLVGQQPQSKATKNEPEPCKLYPSRAQKKELLRRNESKKIARFNRSSIGSLNPIHPLSGRTALTGFRVSGFSI